MKMLIKKKENYKTIIKNIAKESFNDEQKKISFQIIDAANEHNIDAIYQLISQRVKTGFVFDAAPEVNHETVALINEVEELSIMSDEINPINHKLIIGENYDGLKNLIVTYTDSKTGNGLVDVIYIDPPYGTEHSKKEGNDYKEQVDGSKFIYRDKFTRDGWLNLLNERLKLSKRLLTENGLIFVSIDDNNQAYLKVLMDEIFGEDNFVTNIIWQKKKGGGQAKYVYEGHEYILCYAKNKLNISGLTIQNNDVSKSKIKIIDGKEFFINDDIIRKVHGKYEKGTERRCHYEELVEYKGEKIKEEVDEKIKTGEYILIPSNTSSTMHYVARLEALSTKRKIIYSIYNECRTEHGNEELNEKIFDKLVFENPKPSQLIKFLVSLNNNPNSIVLDFFAGSGTTGQAVMELNQEDDGQRKFILVTNNENNIAKDITLERLYRIINGKGSKGEKINWEYSKDLKSLKNNTVSVFDIKYHELSVNDFEKANRLIPLAEEQFRILNPNYKPNNKFDIYNELSALNPYKKV